MERCNAFGRCGGCSLQGVEYEEQLKRKQAAMETLLGGFGRVEPIIGIKDPLHYRNKVQHSFANDQKVRILSGSYEENTHKVVMADNCLLEDQKSRQIMATIRKLIPSFKIPLYNEDTGTGLLRHVLIRRGFTSGEILVVLVTGRGVFPGRSNFVTALRAEHPEITTVVQNINDKRSSMVLGERSIPLYGPGFIKDTLCGCTFRISPDSFYQVNPVQTETLYGKAVEYAGLTGKETVIDAYCGIGTIGLVASKHAGRVIGVELNPNAVRDAIANCKANRISNARFYQGDAGAFLRAMADRKEHADVILMDPPRSGSTREFLDSCVKLGPKRIVYVSCGPDTLARDLAYITKKGYAAEKLQPVDMFPFTEHVETVVLMSSVKE